MARLIQKTGFISRKSAGGYMKYSISKLSEDERQLIYMLFFEDRSERETAKKLGIPLMTLHNKKGAVLAKLLKFLRT